MAWVSCTFQAIADNLQYHSGIDSPAILVKSVHIRPTGSLYARRICGYGCSFFCLLASWLSCARHQTVVPEVPVVPIPGQMVRFEHVFVVVEENQNYEEVIGNTKDLPYLNMLAAKYGVATNYYANTHPSLNNYFYLTAGRSGTRSPWIGDLADKFPGEVAGDNIASVLTANGKTWKAYAESIPRQAILMATTFPM